DEDVAREHLLAAELLDAQTLGVGIAAVARGARALLGRKELEVEKEHSRHTIAEARALRQTPAAPAPPALGKRPLGRLAQYGDAGAASGRYGLPELLQRPLPADANPGQLQRGLRRDDVRPVRGKRERHPRL